MKKLLFIAALVFLSCSKEEIVAPEPASAEYFLTLREVCDDPATKQEFEVSEETYYDIVDNNEKGDCDTVLSVPDKQREVWYEGYFYGHGILTHD